MLQRLREWSTLVLVALLPFHAFFVTVMTKALLGPGHGPMGILALWKEALLAFILLLAGIEMLSPVFRTSAERKLDHLNAVILALIELAILLFIFSDSQAKVFLVGFKYDFLPLLAFLVARRVQWSEEFVERLLKVLFWIGGVIALYGLIAFFLPEKFFVWLGYSNAYSLYFNDASLAAFQKIGGLDVRRIQSTMSGPNQLGLWMLIPWSVVVVGILRLLSGRGKQVYPFAALCGMFVLLSTALLMSFSRAAWIGAALILAVAFWQIDGKKILTRVFAKKRALSLFIAGAAIAGCLVAFSLWYAPDVLIRLGSSRAHLTRPLEAIGRMVEQPLGSGLGTVGPAANRFGNSCIFLRKYDDASWARHFPSLCVYVGGEQVQPVGKTCNCPFLPENWYLQIGVELGILGFILFVALTILVMQSLLRAHRGPTPGPVQHLTLSILCAFVGISAAALFLHAWEDAAVAYSIWMLLAVVL